MRPRPRRRSRSRRCATRDRPRTRRAPRVRSRPGRTSHVEKDVEYFAIFYAIGFSFRAHDTKLFRVGLASRFEELRPADDLRADEATLQIGVDRASRLLRGRAARHGPRADLVLADREEGAEPEQLVRRADETIERRLGKAELVAKRRRLVWRQLRDLSLELRRHGHDRARAMGFRGFADRRDDALGI